MKDKFFITYSVADGYLGGDRPQRVEVFASDIDSDCTDGDLEELAHQVVQNHFEQNISPDISSSRMATFVAWAKGVLAEREK